MADHHDHRWTPQYLKLLAGMRAMELRTALADLTCRPHEQVRHVLIYAQGRSGTTLLASLLQSTGLYTDVGEPLHLYTREVWAPVRHLRGLGRAAQGNIVAHVKGSQLMRARRRPVDPGGFLRTMHDDGWTIVYVRRLGLADQVLSECIARARGAYHKTDDHPENAQLYIDPAEFLTRYDRRLSYAEQDRAALEGLDHIRLIYEDDLMDAQRHQATADRVVAAVGLPARPVYTDLRRIGGADPRKRLENYNEIEAALAARGLDWADSSVPRHTRKV